MGDYFKYRGKCKEMSEDLVKNNPELTLVRGWYYCPISNREEQHWWCEDSEGNIIDETRLQFYSKGQGIYRKCAGIEICSVCGKETLEQEFRVYSFGKYIICSYTCYGKTVL